MAEHTPGTDNQEYKPATFEKRVAAWMGIAYMLLLLGIFLFSLYKPGGSLQGTFPLFLLPACICVSVVIVHRLREHNAPGGPVIGVLVLLICIAGAVFGLLMGLPALFAAFAG